jgi:hypothetical protein
VALLDRRLQHHHDRWAHGWRGSCPPLGPHARATLGPTGVDHRWTRARARRGHVAIRLRPRHAGTTRCASWASAAPSVPKFWQATEARCTWGPRCGRPALPREWLRIRGGGSGARDPRRRVEAP